MSNFFTPQSAAASTVGSTTGITSASASSSAALSAFSLTSSASSVASSGALLKPSGSSPMMMAAASPLMVSSASPASSFPSSFQLSLSATSAPIRIDAAAAAVGSGQMNALQKSASGCNNSVGGGLGFAAGGGGSGSIGTDTDITTTAGSSASCASSFSTKLSNLYVGSLPEGLLLPFLCQQQQLHQQQQQQQLHQQQQQQAAAAAFSRAGSSPFNTQSIATTVQSILAAQQQQQQNNQYLNASLQNTITTTVPQPSNDIDMGDEKADASTAAVSQLQFAFRNHLSGGGGGGGGGGESSLAATSLPPMNLFLNNFMANNAAAANNANSQQQRNSLAANIASSQMETGLVESIAESLNLAQSSNFRRSFSPAGNTNNNSSSNANRPYAASSRTSSESSTANEEPASSSSAVAAAISRTQMTPTESTTTTATGTTTLTAPTPTTLGASFGLVPAVENIKLEAMPHHANANERSGSSSPLKMRSRLNSRNRTMGSAAAAGGSSTPPGGQNNLAEEDPSNICNVCGDEASGRHYGASTCFGCKGFFRRTVRANKTYSCRYEERCEIDKIGRNTCRSCRFRKCLDVGMEPDAIRPDRDKTGRQRNPRRQSIALPTHPMSAEAAAAAIRAATSLPSSHDSGALTQHLTDDEGNGTAAAAAAALGDVGAASAGRRATFPASLLRAAGGHTAAATAAAASAAETAATDALSAEAMVAERDLVIETLLEIERICANLRDVPHASDASKFSDAMNNNGGADDDDDGGKYDPHAAAMAADAATRCACASRPATPAFEGELSLVIARPSLVSTRTQVDFTGQRGAIHHGSGANSAASKSAECCERRDFQRAFRRLLTLSVDFANTLKPIADISIQQRENLVRSCVAPYMVFLCAFRTVSAGRTNCILLPDGRYIDQRTPLSAFIDPAGLSPHILETLASKIRYICKSVIDCVQSKMEKMSMSEVEFVCLKAIIALDPSALGVDAPTAQLLSVARDSVQSALFLHLMERHNSQQAVFRFGQLLMMISNVSKIGAFLYNAMEMIAAVSGDLASSATLRFFTGLDKLGASAASRDAQELRQRKISRGGVRPKEEKMSDESDDFEDDEMDDD